MRRGGRTVSQKQAVLMLGAASAVLYAVTAVAQRRWLNDSADGNASLSRLVVVAASLGSALLIWKILGDVRPGHQFVGTLAYLWNPLIVVEVATEGHNDSLVVFSSSSHCS